MDHRGCHIGGAAIGVQIVADRLQCLRLRNADQAQPAQRVRAIQHLAGSRDLHGVIGEDQGSCLPEHRESLGIDETTLRIPCKLTIPFEQRFAAGVHDKKAGPLQCQIPPDATNVKIDAQGQITATLDNNATATTLGRIELAAFPAPNGLSSIGNDTFAPTAAAGDPSIGHPGDPGFGQVQQGALEMANVNMVSEMASLVIAQRAYQLNARLIQAADQILSTINNLRN